MAPAGNEARSLQFVERTGHGFPRGSDHLGEHRVANGKVDADSVATHAAVAPCQLEELPAHAFDVARVGEVSDRLLLLSKRRRHLVEQRSRDRWKQQQFVECMLRNRDQAGIHQPEQDLRLRRREQDPSGPGFTRDDRTCSMRQRNAENAETFVDEQERGGWERRAEVGLARRNWDRRTAGQDLHSLGSIVGRGPLEQTNQTLTATFAHEFLVLLRRTLLLQPLARHTRRVNDPVVIPSGGGEVIGDSADRRVEILSDDDSLHATWSRFARRREGADLHIHQHHTDMFYVLDGELTVMLGTEGETAVVPAGTLARVPPLVVHGFRNGSDAEVRYLNFHAPGQRFADFLRALRDGRSFTYDQHPPPSDGGRPIAEAVVGDGERRDGVTVLADIEAIAIAELNAGSAPQPAHVHRRHIESFYVLDGELTLTVGGRELRAETGSWVQVPPGMPHTLTGTARFLDLHSPSYGLGALDQEPA